MIERMPFEDRESIRIAYVPVDAVNADVKKLLDVRESVTALSPDAKSVAARHRCASTKVGCRFSTASICSTTKARGRSSVTSPVS
jgi:hypothetical protein